jgi:hypothetical protein
VRQPLQGRGEVEAHDRRRVVRRHRREGRELCVARSPVLDRELHRERAHVLVTVLQQRQQGCVVEHAEAVQGEHGAQALWFVCVRVAEHADQCWGHAVGLAFAQQPSGGAGVELVVVEQQRHELRLAHRREVPGCCHRAAVGDLVDAAVAAIPRFGFAQVAVLVVVPVEQVDVAVGRLGDRDAEEPAVVDQQEVGTVAADVARTPLPQQVHVEPRAVQVGHQDGAFVGLRPQPPRWISAPQWACPPPAVPEMRFPACVSSPTWWRWSAIVARSW